MVRQVSIRMPKPESPNPRHRPRRILLVDDDPDTLASLKMVIEGNLEDSIVLGAESAESARRILASNRIDLVVSDYKMPDEDGLQFLAELPGAEHVPKVLMTGYPAMGLAVQAMEKAHIQALTVKPVDVPKMIRILRNVLAHEDESFYYATPA